MFIFLEFALTMAFDVVLIISTVSVFNFDMFIRLNCRIPRNESCSAQPPKMATRTVRSNAGTGSESSKLRIIFSLVNVFLIAD